MIARPLVLAALLVASLPTIAEQIADDGAAIFKEKCQDCHTLSMAQGLLEPKPPADRPAHLTRFLQTHPARLNDAERATVIEFLSRDAR